MAILNKRSLHVFDLSEDRTQSPQLELAKGIVQVLRCDRDATLFPKHETVGIPATPGIVFENVRGVDLFTTIDGGSNQFPGGVLILAVYPSLADVLDVAQLTRAWGTRILEENTGAPNVAVTFDIPAPNSRTLYYITGYNAGYDAAPTPASPTLSFWDFKGEAANSPMYTRQVPRGGATGDPLSIETFFPYPFFCRPGANLRMILPAGGAGVSGNMSVYGGTLAY